MTIEVITARLHPPSVDWKREIDGPTRRQAEAMGAFRLRLIEAARKADAEGNRDLAFDLDCEAWNVERDLRKYGFTRYI